MNSMTKQPTHRFFPTAPHDEAQPPKQHITAEATISFNIGGMYNTSTAVPVRLNIHSSKETLQAMFKIIADIEKIHLYSTRVKQEDLHALMSQITFIFELDISHDIKESIKNATILFLQKTLNAMPHHNIEPGDPGYEASEQERLRINQVLIVMNHELLKTRFFATTHLALINPSEEEVDAQPLSFSFLPQNLDAFLQSIENNDFCKSAWEERFKKVDAHTLSVYFRNMISTLYTSINKQALAEYLAHKLTIFTDALALRSSHFGIQIMRDVINRASSPLPQGVIRSELSSTTLSELTKTQESLKTQIPALLNAETFNSLFYQFRQSLTLSLQKHPLLKHVILHELEDYLITLDKSSRRVLSLQQYIERCITRLASPLHTEHLTRLNMLREIYQTAQSPSRQSTKLLFLETLSRFITDYPEKTYAECIRLAHNTLPENGHELFNERRTLPFLYQHRFKHLITAISESEPDYDRLYPSINTRREMRLSSTNSL